MKLKKIIFFIFLIFYFLNSYSQLEFVEEKEIKAKQFSIDILGNFYFLQNNNLRKTLSENNLTYNYDSKSNGLISQIDVSNPFVSLLYYKEINRIVFLDNNFSELRTPINLDDLGFFSTNIICNSHKGFWLYDMQQSHISLIDNNLKTIATGINLYQIIGNDSPVFMKETNNFIFLQLNSNKIIILDKFGNYFKTYKFNNTNYIDTFNDNIFLLDGQTLTKYSIQEDSETKVTIPKIDNIIEFNVYNNFIYFLTNEKLIKYKFF
ncbi:MAG: hypothetical protein LBV69_06580 [Bacteroidales bacterium]|jgi:hypothetical protein|nr:hypothetical protein [Bacteroidales bacterium]